MKNFNVDDVIDKANIERLLAKSEQVTNNDIEAVLVKAEQGKGLSLNEAAILLSVNSKEMLDKLFATAGKVKQKIYGRRIVLFAPLYVANYCVNGCVYCGFKHENSAMPRIKLEQEAIVAETLALLKMGHKRIALETGEDPHNIDINYILESIKTIYGVNYKGHNLRRININIAATSIDDYKKLHQAEIGTYILFQESYHQPTYEAVHPTGPKSNYNYHTTAHHRAMQAGIEDVGLGVLYGLYNYKYETLAMLGHSMALERDFGAGAHTISVPRLREALGSKLDNFKHLVDDNDFLKIIAVIRLTLPYVGLILSTREDSELRFKALELGISQISAASCTDVGGYSGYKKGEVSTAQFNISDDRPLNEVVASLCNKGYLPSFCTACYRQGRTGETFMGFAKSGNIEKYCTPNALLTFKEYTKEFAPNLVNANYFDEQLNTESDGKIRQVIREALNKIEKGEHDLYL
jgi:2-iminoacetate synthase